ncbi:VirB2 family type IV secretion system major pilin TrwL [Bartonella machadoae]|uniref:VirB2 family type IV secretion system major pilin TrwL n=1 Tax=Bartonella machadoae TaxID=2893471 RepID=UPI001F4C9A61|nr:VirB2 family type IV secretion system major pilin TrwL [Bartonella machadoae]UNE54084.1 VirB2 family type IV secretion system major pilin TrwL [Bartonella machadoae]
MKRLLNFYSKNNNISNVIAATVTVFFISSPVYASKNLDTAKGALTNLQKELTGKIIPVAAAVILLCLAIGYAGRYIEKDTFVRWAIGVVIAGSATQLATLLFTGTA